MMGQAPRFTQQLLALSAVPLCLPFRKLWANNDAWRKGSQLGLCVAQKAATPSIVAWAEMGGERRGRRPEGSDTRQRVPSDSCHVLGIQGISAGKSTEG